MSQSNDGHSTFDFDRNNVKTENRTNYDRMDSLVFIYHKDGKIKVLDLKSSKEQHNQLMLDNWVHTQTLNTCVWIEYLFNDAEGIDILEEIKGLSMKPF